MQPAMHVTHSHTTTAFAGLKGKQWALRGSPLKQHTDSARLMRARRSTKSAPLHFPQRMQRCRTPAALSPSAGGHRPRAGPACLPLPSISACALPRPRPDLRPPAATGRTPRGGRWGPERRWGEERRSGPPPPRSLRPPAPGPAEERTRQPPPKLKAHQAARGAAHLGRGLPRGRDTGRGRVPARSRVLSAAAAAAAACQRENMTRAGSGRGRGAARSRGDAAHVSREAAGFPALPAQGQEPPPAERGEPAAGRGWGGPGSPGGKRGDGDGAPLPNACARSGLAPGCWCRGCAEGRRVLGVRGRWELLLRARWGNGARTGTEAASPAQGFGEKRKGWCVSGGRKGKTGHSWGGQEHPKRKLQLNVNRVMKVRGALRLKFWVWNSKK